MNKGVRHKPATLDGCTIGQVSWHAEKSGDLASERCARRGPTPCCERLAGPLDLITDNPWYKGREKAGGEVFYQQPNQVPPVVVGLKRPAACYATTMVDSGRGLVDARPVPKLRAKGKVQVLQVGEKLLVE
jgi:hypothetical protein